MFQLVLGLVLVLGINECSGKPPYGDAIPNGKAVPNPCAPAGTTWLGVGHTTPSGGGTRNLFGSNFLDEDLEWTNTLCTMDSDADGVSNGAELGDPDCTWTKGAAPTRNATGHPGICEPISLVHCQLQNNNWNIQCDMYP
ncbi:temptin-like [Mizuhopecten yessoensis]|uniref:Temptin n=1 Tax=Mizuhopecten yessoensis TaxID=6573 RepID=A0A210Q0H1_MIZYE|nr:temptin-like [Mizuhopecten yessoensis]OWF42159.1 Temptin [Mizuhopecten yessoensis]